MSLVSEVVTKFRRKYPACDATRALELFNDVHKELATRSQFRNKEETISLTAGTREYDLPSGVYQIHEAYYETSSTPSDWRVLYERSTDEYVVKRKGWRSAETENEPVEFYISSAASGDSSKAVIGFDPVPPETTATYPRVRLYVTSIVALDASDTVPPQIINDNVYVYGMQALWAADKVPADIQLTQSLATREMERNVQHIKGLQNRDTELIPAHTLRLTRVV